MPPWMAALLGIVEGLTEYLPVSSTGHLVLARHVLGLPADDANNSFVIVIQLGAILAVLVHYRTLLATHVAGLLRRNADSVRLALSLLAAFVPTVVVALLLQKPIKRLLFAPLPIAIALVVGGVGMIVVERWLTKRSASLVELTDIQPRQGFIIGLVQCLSLWPGTSRAMTTILGGRCLGMTPRVAAEFSFLLALPVLGAATVYDLLKAGRALVGTSEARLSLAIGFGVSFVVAWAVIAAFLQFLRRWSLAIFGWYRIVFGVLVLVLLRSS